MLSRESTFVEAKISFVNNLNCDRGNNLAFTCFAVDAGVASFAMALITIVCIRASTTVLAWRRLARI